MPVAAPPAPAAPAPGGEPDPRAAFNAADIARYRKLMDEIAGLQALEVRLHAAVLRREGEKMSAPSHMSSFPWPADGSGQPDRADCMPF